MTTASEHPGARKNAHRRLTTVLAVAALLTGLTSLAAPPAVADETFSARMLELANQARSANGVAPLTRVMSLENLAQDAPYSGCGFTVSGRAFDMGQRNYFSHTISGCGKSVFDMMNAAGVAYSAAAENIGWIAGTTNPTTAADMLHDSFMQSSGHRANVLDGRFNAVGIGSWVTGSGQSWTGAGAARTKVTITAVVFASVPNVVPAGPTAPPAAPAWAAVDAGNASVAASWAAVPATPSVPVDAYAVLLYNPNGYTGTYRIVEGTTTSVTFTGLANGSAYAVGVLGGNALGWGGITYSGWVTAGTPSEPRNVSAWPGSRLAQVSWSPSASTNGSAIQNYAALAMDTAGSYTGQHAVVCGTCTSATVTGLNPGQSYYLLVLALNARGWGAGAGSNWITAQA